MNLFFINCFFAFGYMGVQGLFTLYGFLVGFTLGYAALWLTQPLYSDTKYFQRALKTTKLIAYFVWDLLMSNLKVLWDVVTPQHISRPGIVGVPLRAKTDLEILLVSNMISLTPGTLSIDLSADRKILYVHVMFLDDPEAFRKSVREGIEHRLPGSDPDDP